MLPPHQQFFQKLIKLLFYTPFCALCNKGIAFSKCSDSPIKRASCACLDGLSYTSDSMDLTHTLDLALKAPCGSTLPVIQSLQKDEIDFNQKGGKNYFDRLLKNNCCPSFGQHHPGSCRKRVFTPKKLWQKKERRKCRKTRRFTNNNIQHPIIIISLLPVFLAC